ncbi:calmodulin-like [Liolophura sinensis]|uniref:calmodulin-like n=1 Tax=Liolophura sinensis TaxID=3198878 RepID=UPI003158C42F
MPLTPAERQNCEACFRKFDKNGDGTLSIQEMVQLIRALGWSPQKFPDSAICDWFLEVDKNKSRSVDLQEFLTVCENRPRTEVNEANLRRTFKEFDQDGSGTISAAELKQALSKCNIKISDADAKSMIQQADKSGDGQIDVEEFLAVFQV